nr:MAG TPA: hypothetical protein [Caudoviricetes sp.]
MVSFEKYGGTPPVLLINCLTIHYRSPPFV